MEYVCMMLYFATGIAVWDVKRVNVIHVDRGPKSPQKDLSKSF